MALDPRLNTENAIRERAHVAAGVIECEALEWVGAKKLEAAGDVFQIACAAAVEADTLENMLAHRRGRR